LSGSNQFVLFISAVAAIVGFLNKVTFEKNGMKVAENINQPVPSLYYLWLAH
jgi:NhaC family Na+:H+ antiporter